MHRVYSFLDLFTSAMTATFVILAVFSFRNKKKKKK